MIDAEKNKKCFVIMGNNPIVVKILLNEEKSDLDKRSQ